jgi:hypothetical protein
LNGLALTNIHKEHPMKTVRNIALAAAAAGALALGSAALSQEEKKPAPTAKPEASQPHRGEHRAGHGRHGMGGMHEMRSGCHGESGSTSGGEHNHS